MPKAKNRGPQTQAKRKYNEKSYDIVTIFVKKGNKEKIKDYAASKKISLNECIKSLLYDKMNEDGVEISDEQEHKDE